MAGPSSSKSVIHRLGDDRLDVPADQLLPYPQVLAWDSTAFECGVRLWHEHGGSGGARHGAVLRSLVGRSPRSNPMTPSRSDLPTRSAKDNPGATARSTGRGDRGWSRCA